MKRSKQLVRFLNRAARFDSDLELADVLAAAVIGGDLSEVGSKLILSRVSPAKHLRLAKHKPTAHNRQLLMAHLKATLYSAFLKDLYEDVTEYITEIIAGAARNGLNPNRLLGDHKIQVDANDLLQAGSWNATVDLVASSLFRTLEGERSTTKLLDAFDKKLGLGVDPTIVAESLPYLELRHLLIHSDGVADKDFCLRYPKFGAVAGEPIAMGWDLTNKARAAVVALVKHYDECVVGCGLLASGDLQ